MSCSTRPTYDALYQDLKEYNREIEWDFLEYFVKQYRRQSIMKVSTKSVWIAFENIMERNGEKERMEGVTSKMFQFSIKQKTFQIIRNTQNYEEALLYSTPQKRRAMNGNDFYMFNIDKLTTY